MTALQVANPYTQLLSLSGTGLNTGHVYIGKPNQDPVSFPQAVYWDEALTIPATQPLNVVGGYIINSGSPARAYVGGAYSIKVTDKNGVQVFYLPEADSGDTLTVVATIAALRALTGPVSSLVYVLGYYASNDGGQGPFIYDSTDTTTADNGGTVIVDAGNDRWKRAFNGPVYLKWFGAKGDGSTVDTTAAKNALASAYNVMAEPGTFMVDPGQLAFAAAGQQLVGLDGVSSILKMRQAATAGQQIVGATSLAGVQVRNLVIDGGGFANPVNAGVPIGLSLCPDAVIEGVTIQNVNRYGIAVTSCDRLTIRRCRVTLPQLISIRLVSLTAGTGGTANQTNLSATVTGGSPTRPETVLYDTTAGGAVTNVRFQGDGQGYSVAAGVPTVTFPAVPGASCVVALAGTGVYAVVASAGSGVSQDMLVEDGTFTGAGLDLSTFNGTFRRNHVSGALFGAGFVTEQLAGVGSNTFEGNTVEHIGLNTASNTWLGPDINNTVGPGMELWGAQDQAFRNICRQNADNGIGFGANHGQCSFNQCYDNGRYYLQQGGPYQSPGVGLRWGSSTYNANGASVRGNQCYDNNGASGGQAYGIATSSTPPTGLLVEGNDCQGNRVQDYKFNGAVLASFVGRQLQASAIWAPGTIANGANASTTITVAGLDVGTKWLLSAQHTGSNNLNLNKVLYMPGANTAQIVLCNNSGGSLGTASGTLMVQASEFSTFYN